MRVEKVLLFSGGMDSLALAHLWKPDLALFVRMGTTYDGVEEMRLPKLSCPTTVVDLLLSRFELQDKIIPLRNLFLVAIGAQFGNRIALAATAGDRVLDKHPIFAQLTSCLFTYLWQPQYWTPGENITVELPIKHLTKRQILEEYERQGGDLEWLAQNSFSCYQPTPYGNACGECKPCFRKWVAFKLCGVTVKPDSRPYIKSVILPLIEAGRYGRKDEEQEILEALDVQDRVYRQ